MEPQVREAVVQEEEVGRGLQPAQGLEAGLVAVGAHDHGDPGELAGQEHRLVPGHEGPEERPLARAHHPHAPALAAVAAREDADGESRGPADGRRSAATRGVLPEPPQWRLPTLTTGRGRRRARARYHRRRSRWAPP